MVFHWFDADLLLIEHIGTNFSEASMISKIYLLPSTNIGAILFRSQCVKFNIIYMVKLWQFNVVIQLRVLQ